MQVNDLVSLILAHKWLGLVALLVSWGTALMSPDSRFPVSVPKRWQPLTVLALSLIGVGVKAVGSGVPWQVWLVHSALAAFMAYGGYAIVVKAIFNDNPPPWMKALALMLQPPSSGGSAGGPHRSASVPPKADPPAAAKLSLADRLTDALARRAKGVATAAAFGIAVLIGVSQIGASCQPAANTVVTDMTPAAACIAGALAEGGVNDPMVIVGECAGTTIEDVINVIADLLEHAPNVDAAVADDAGKLGMSPEHARYLRIMLQKAHRAKAANESQAQ